MGLPFERIKEAEGFNIINTAMNVAAGFAEGLTTLPVGDWIGIKQNNTVDTIANSIGSLMGFIGIVPGPGLLGKLGVAKLAKGLGYSEAARVLSEAPVKFGVKSLPMLIADKTMNAIERSGIKAVAEGTKFLKSGTLIGDMAQGAMHLGIASAVGAAPIYDISPETIINERMSGFASGAIFGAGNRLIGNMFNRGGMLDLTKTATGQTADDILKIAETDKNLAMELLKKSDRANTLARAFSSSIAFGLPSTLRDDPLELQVYEYLLNAYFGGKELSISQRKAMEVSMPFQATGRRALLHPEKFIPGYEDLDPAVKGELQIQKELELGGRLNDMSTASAAFLSATTDATAEIQRRLDAGEITKKQAENLQFFDAFQKKVEQYKKDGKPYDEADIVEEVAQEQAEIGFKEYVTETQMNLLKQMIGDIGNIQNYAAVEDAAKMGVAISDLDDFYREKKMNYFRPMFKDIATAALQARGAKNTTEAYLESYDMEKSLITAMSEYKAESADFMSKEFTTIKDRENTFYNKVEKALGYKIPEEGDMRKKLRAAFLNIDYAEARVPLEVAPNGDITEPTAYKDNSLREVIQYAPPAPITEIVTNFRELKEYRQIDGEKKAIHEVIGEKPELFVKILENLYKQGRAFYGGKKMDSNLFTGDFTVTPEEAQIIAKQIQTLPALKRKGKEYNILEEYQSGLKRYKELGGNKLTYDHNFVNNLNFIRMANFPDIPLERMDLLVRRMNEGDFVYTPADFNKRTQLFGAYELRVPDELMKDEMGEYARYVILNAVNKDGTPHGKFDIDYTDKDADGKEIKSKEHLDGPLFVRQRTYDAMMRVMGKDENTGSAKGSHMDFDSELGLLMGKYAYHVADPKLDALMEENNWDFVYFDTSAKQKGLRQSADFWIKDGKLDFGDTNIEDITYATKWGGFSVTLTENPLKPGKRETVPAQSGDNIYDVDAQKAFIDTFVSPHVNGTEEMNKLFMQYEGLLASDVNKANELADKIDLDDLSIENKLRMLQGQVHRKGVLQKSLLMDIMNLDEDLESFKDSYQDGIADRENIEYMQDYLRAQGAAQKIITSGDISLAVTQLPGIKSYFETALKKYLLKSYVTPKSKFIHKGVIRPHAFMDFEENPLQRGRYRLAEGLREKIIEVPEELHDILGKTTTLGKAWDEYGHLFKTEQISVEPLNDEVTKFLEEPFLFMRLKMTDGSVKSVVMRPKIAKGSVISKVNIEGIDAWVYKDAETNTWTTRIVGQGYHTGFFSTKKRAIENAAIQARNAKEKGTLESTIEKARKFFDEGLRSGSLELYTREDNKFTTFKVEKPTQTTPVPKTEIPEAVREMFRNAVVRVPMDSPSGLRMLQFDGFVKGQKGTGIFLRPEDMKEIGGADTDIDTAFIMFSNSKPMRKVKDYYEGKKDARRNPKTGGFIDPKDDLETFKAEKDEPLHLFDPVSLYRVNQMAYEGNQLLGPMLSFAKRMKVLLRKKKAEGDNVIRGYNEKGREVFNAKIRPDAEEVLEKLTSSIVNFAADSADGIKLKDRKTIENIFFEKILTDFRRKEGKSWVAIKPGETGEFIDKFNKKVTYQKFNKNQIPEYATLQNLDNIFKDRVYEKKNGRSEARKMSLQEMALALQKYTTEEMPGYRYKVVSMLGKQNIGSNIAWRGEQANVDKLFELLDKAFLTQRKGKDSKEFDKTEIAQLFEEITGARLMVNQNQKARKKALKSWDERTQGMKDRNPELWAIRRSEFINDMMRNDLRVFSDAIFTMNKYNELLKSYQYDKRDALRIKEFVTKYKELYQTLANSVQADENIFTRYYLDDKGKVRLESKPGKYHQLTKEVVDKIGEEYYSSRTSMDPEVRKALNDYGKSDLIPAERDFFETLMLSSYKTHSFVNSFEKEVDPYKRKFNEVRKKIGTKYNLKSEDLDKALDKFDIEKPVNTTILTETVSADDMAELFIARTATRQAEKAFRQVNRDSQWFDKPYITGRIINEYTKQFNQVVSFTETPLDKYIEIKKLEDVNDIYKFTNNENVNLDNKAKPLGLYEDQFAEEVSKFTPREIKNYTEMQKLKDEYKQLLIDNPHLIAHSGDMFIKFSEVMYGIPRSYKDMTMEEFRTFVGSMKDLTTKNIGDIKLEKRHYFFLPDSLNNLHYTKDVEFMLLRKPVFDSEKNTFIEQNVRYPMSNMEVLNELGHVSLRAREEMAAKAEEIFSNTPLIKFMNVLTSSNKDANASLLFEYVVQQRLKRQFEADKEWAIKNNKPFDFDDVMKQIEDTERRVKESGILEKEWNIMSQGEGGGSSKIFKGKDVVRDMDSLLTKFYDDVWKKEVLKEFTRKDGQKSSAFLFINEYDYTDPNYEDAIEHHFGNYGKERSRKYTAKALYSTKGKKYVTNPNWLDIDGILDGLATSMLNKVEINNAGINLKDMMQHQYAIENRTYAIVSYEGGLKTIHSVKPSTAPTFEKKIEVLNSLWNYKSYRDVRDENGDLVYDETGNVIKEEFFPHRAIMQMRDPLTPFADEWKQNYFPKTMHTKAQIEKRLQKKLENARTDEEKASLMLQYARKFGADEIDMEDANEAFLNLYDTSFGTGSGHTGKVPRSESLMSRDRLNPLAGYATSPKVMLNYLKKVLTEYHDGVGMLTMMRQVDKFKANNKGESIKYWEGFMRNRIRTTFGYPSNFSPEWVNDPNAKIKGNLYHYVTEDKWANKASIFDRFFGITPEMRKTHPKTIDVAPEDILREFAKKGRIPIKFVDVYQTHKKVKALQAQADTFEKQAQLAQLREEYKDKLRKAKGHNYTDKQVYKLFEKLDKFVAELPPGKNKMIIEGETVDPFKKLRETLVASKLASLSNMEGKMSMMSLLFHPKSAMVNMISSYQNTIASTGFEHFKNAGKLEIVSAIMNKKSWEEIEDAIDRLGGIESQYKYEADLSQTFKSENSKRFFQRAMEAIQKNNRVDDATLFEIAKQEGLTEAFVNKSAYFMKLTERLGRKRAWLAHYLKGREILSATKYSYDWNDPWLIQFANRGVAATQFLYHNAARPEFARTSLGKIFARFQTFAMNSIHFRRELYKRGQGANWKGDNKEKFERLLTADIFVLALASALPFSLFNSVVAPPINYIAELAKYLFGDDETRERAFFGSFPYPLNIIQPVLPPSSRYFTSVINMLFSGDVERFVDYHMWTWFPFGRIANDIRKSLENPRMAPERMIGIPFNTLIDKMRESQKDSPSKED